MFKISRAIVKQRDALYETPLFRTFTLEYYLFVYYD